MVATKDRGATFSDLLRNVIFRDVILPLSVTVGSYIAASIIHVCGSSFGTINEC